MAGGDVGLLNGNDTSRQVSIVAEQAGTHLLPLRKSEIALLELIRALGYGLLHEVHVADGQPVLIEKQCEKIRLV